MKARVNIQTAKRNYAPGEVIDEKISAVDMIFLRKHHFLLEESEEAETPMKADVHELEKEQEEEKMDSAEYKDEIALKKLNKEELVNYAKSIGLSLAPEMLKNDMIDALLNYIGEKSEWD